MKDSHLLRVYLRTSCFLTAEVLGMKKPSRGRYVKYNDPEFLANVADIKSKKERGELDKVLNFREEEENE